MATNAAVPVLFLLMAILCMQAFCRDRCEKTTPVSDGVSFVTQTCVYNGCYGCYSEYVGDAESDQDCRDYYKTRNNVWQSYKCCKHTPDKCPKPAGGYGGGFMRDTPFKRFLDIAQSQKQRDA